MEAVILDPATGGMSITDTPGVDESIISDGVGPDFVLKGISDGTGINVSSNANNVIITNSSPASSVVLSSAGAGESLVNDGTGPNLATKGLGRTGNALLSSTASTVTIDVPNVVIVDIGGTLTPAGTASVSGNGGMAVGPGAQAAGTAVSVGEDSESAANGCSYGYDAKATAAGGTSLGRGSRATGTGAASCGFFARARGNRSQCFGTCDTAAPAADANIIGNSDGSGDCSNSTTESFMVARVNAGTTTTMLATNNDFAFVRGRLHSRHAFALNSTSGTAGVITLSGTQVVGFYLVVTDAALTTIALPIGSNVIAGNGSFQNNWWAVGEGGDLYIANRTGGPIDMAGDGDWTLFNSSGVSSAGPWTRGMNDGNIHHWRIRYEGGAAFTAMYMGHSDAT